MSRELKIDAATLQQEVTWLNRMPTVLLPEAAVVQVTSLLSAVLLRRTCFDQYRESVIPCQGVGQQTVLVDATKLAAALRTVSGTLVVTVGEDELRIADSDRTVRLAAAKLDFPKWPQFEGQGKEAVRSEELAHAMTSVGTDDTLPQLMVLAFDDGTMVTTDRFRLSAITYASSGFTGKVSSAVARAFTKATGAVFVEAGTCVGESASWIELRSGMRTVTAPMPDITFPQWRKFIPDNPPLQVVLSRDDLLKAATDEEITLTVNGDTLLVTSENDGVTTEQRIKLFTTLRNTFKEPFTVTIKSAYLADCLREIDSGLVRLSGIAPEKPVVFQNVGLSDLHLIMPVKGSSTARQRNTG